MEAMARLGVLTSLQPKFVQGENLGQTFSFVSSGNAQLGFVALSQVLEDGKIKSGSVWIVPAHLYEPIRQDAVLLNRAKDNPAAAALMSFLRSERAKVAIRSFGYEL
jgi:molybdate transport system substrate-binding protein